jgi:repressor LexA
MTSKPLTSRQNQVLTFISDHIDNSGFPPTRNEVSEYFGFRSPNAAESHLRALEKKGVIRIERGRSRGITLTSLSAASLPPKLSIPLVGRVAAGTPILAVENIEDVYHFDPSLFTPRPHYLLRVEGMSMRDAGIRDQDLLAVHRTPDIRNGQIVVVRVDDEVTVKRFHKQGDRLTLLPENPDFQPIEVDLRKQDVTIEGLGVGVIRNQLDA